MELVIHRILLRDATLVLPDTLIEHGWLLIEGKTIRDLGGAATCPTDADMIIEGQGDLVLPGLIDLHSDAIEKLVQPRPGVLIDTAVALNEADWRLAGCGVTTEFHAISLDDAEFGVRSDGFAEALLQAIADADGAPDEQGLLIRHRIHARLEISSDYGEASVADLIRRGSAQLVSLMDHSPGQGQFTSEQAYRDYIARTTAMADADIDALLEYKRRQMAGSEGRIARTSALALEYGIALATHDDDSPAKVDQWLELGVAISEFPITLEAARQAHQRGMVVCMGAPNVLRGQSSGGNLSALAAIEAGVVDALCADYYPSSMLAAVFKLVDQGYCSLPEAVNLVTRNPARAVGMEMYGSLEVGKMADVIVVRCPTPAQQTVRAAIVGGRLRVQRA